VRAGSAMNVMQTSDRRAGASGFTLIELLVVVAIIMLLLTMLMPLAERARFQAGVVACRSNLHQWGVASHTYAAEHKGALPRFNHLGPTSGCTWDMGKDFWPNGLAAYGITPPMYFCPLDKTEWARLQYIGHHHTDWWMYRSYIYWVGRTGVGFSGLTPRVDADGDGVAENPPLRVSDSHHYALMSDGILAGFGGLNTRLENVNVDGDPISGGHRFRGRLENVNVLFLDGRIELRRRDQIRARCSNPWGPLIAWY
jgi:prepilin-type N-terminal cleavage/methylation domain-containing protein